MFGDTDRLMRDRTRALARYGLKTGPFTGYRAYPDTGIPVDDPASIGDRGLYTNGFCFGHGLTYTTFRYTDLRITDGQVTFKAVNTGKRVGTAVPQLYIGMEDSRLIRPDRELCGCLRVTLEPGESRELTMPLRLPQAEDGKSGQRVTESGTYTVMIGESAADIRLKKFFSAEGIVPEGGREPLYRYCVSESNIVQEGYTLEANYTMKKRNPKNLILGFVLLVLAAGTRFLLADLGVNSTAVSIMTLILFLCAAVCFVFEIVERSRQETQLITEVEELNDRFFADAESVAAPNASRVFVKEFDTPKKTGTVPVNDGRQQDDEYKYIDRAYSLSNVTDDFIRYAQAHGYEFGVEAVRTMLSAISSSHLLIPCGMSEDDTSVLQELLCGFFDTIASVSPAQPVTDDETGLLMVGSIAAAAFFMF